MFSFKGCMILSCQYEPESVSSTLQTKWTLSNTGKSVIYCLLQFSVSVYENGKHLRSNGTEDRNTVVVWSV